MGWAALKKLPVVFICENNLYSTTTSLKDRQAPVEIYKRAEGYGMPGVRGDGNDALDVHAKVLEAVARARRGDGPTLLEFMTYRWREHVGPNHDWDLGYRTQEEVESWMARCPVKKLAAEFPSEEVAAYTQEIEAEIDGSLAFARASAFPGKEALSL
jgi:pyruvate dehydrogenase E1 component alpha subunit